MAEFPIGMQRHFAHVRKHLGGNKLTRIKFAMETRAVLFAKHEE